MSNICHRGEAGRVPQCCRPSSVLHIKECAVQRKHTAMKDRAITAWSSQHLFPPAQLLRAFFPDLANRSGSLRREGAERRRSRWRRWWDLDGGRGPSPDLCSWTVYNFGFEQQAEGQSVFCTHWDTAGMRKERKFENGCNVSCERWTFFCFYM